MTAGENDDTGNDDTGEGIKPRRRGQEPLRPPLPKKFYKLASIVSNAAGQFQIQLDGRSIKTPKKRALQLPSSGLAAAIANEWQAQIAVINPATMPLTRIANTAIDAVADTMLEVGADVVAYSGSDLVCYRAEAPPELIERQSAAWEPVLAWAKSNLGARFVLSQGVMPVEQPQRILLAVAAAVAPLGPFHLTAVHVLTTLTGSALLALAHASNALTAEQVWNAAHIDEDWQIELWGPDDEAAERRAARRIEFDGACAVLALLRA